MKSNFLFLAAIATSVNSASTPEACAAYSDILTILKDCDVPEICIAQVPEEYNAKACIYSPVCGSNGKTYLEECTIQLEGCVKGPGPNSWSIDPAKKVTIAYRGKCNDTTTPTTTPAGPTPKPAGPTPNPAGPTPMPSGPTPMPSGPTPIPPTTTANNTNSSSGAGDDDIKFNSGAESLTAASLGLVLGIVMYAL